MPPAPRPLAERFWPKVIKTSDGGCWLWTAATNQRGYGVINLGPRGSGIALAHRVAWQLCGYPAISDGLFLCHKCDQPACVNPDHLFTGTHNENMADMMRKGRSVRGEDRADAKLSAADVREVFALSKRGVSQYRIADQFGVCQPHISRVLSGQVWSHMGDRDSA
jgi:hypothetical protein